MSFFDVQALSELRKYRIKVSIQVQDENGNLVDSKGKTPNDYTHLTPEERKATMGYSLTKSYTVDDFDSIETAGEQANNIHQIIRALSDAIQEKAISERVQKGEKE